MGKVVEKILEALQFRAELTVDLLGAVFSDRATFYRDTRRFYRHGPREFKTDWAEWYRQRQGFYSLLNQLKRDGLVMKKQNRGKKTSWTITKKGIEKLVRADKRERRPGGILLRQYPQHPTGGLVIIAFDIPEVQRQKRKWLRENLIALNLAMLQKSVWAGNVKIPEEFIQDLRAQDLLPYVHIFSVSRSGTIKRTVQR